MCFTPTVQHLPGGLDAIVSSFFLLFSKDFNAKVRQWKWCMKLYNTFCCQAEAKVYVICYYAMWAHPSLPSVTVGGFVGPSVARLRDL